MLRLLVLLLLLANGAWFAWSHGHLSAWGLAPAQQAEPQRVAQQIRPDSVRILNADDARRLEAAAGPRPAECLMAGPLDEARLPALRQQLEGWPAGSWQIEPGLEPARWIVYMGRYPSADFVNRKKAELRQLGVSFEPLVTPALEPGLSLGGFPSQAEADRRLAELASQGVRTARVLQERTEVRGQVLRLPAVDDALRARLDELKTALAGRPWRGCR